MVQIQLRDLHLQFRVRQRGRVTLKEFLVMRMFRRSVNPYIEVNALDGINLTIHEGERLGIIGHNGAGKSTLLKVLAGIYPPTHGSVDIEGRICSMLDVGVGIEPDATGWDNITYRCYLQGDTPTEVAQKKQAIADFSELGDALRMPVRFYSTGMQVRLIFSIATAVEPEILLLDEILGAGDMNFQEKARQRMLSLIERARLMVIASHDMQTLQRLCSRVIWLDHGHILQDGPPQEVISQYQEFMTRGSKAAA
jgi:ABC-type polysaccharide/polyol phosphate transport system ATPase subunit